jgi:hypothetical protein
MKVLKSNSSGLAASLICTIWYDFSIAEVTGCRYQLL